MRNKYKNSEQRKGKGNSASIKRIGIPFYGGRNISPLFEEMGRLEEITNERNVTILQINVCGKRVKLYYSGKIPETCKDHKILVYQEIQGNDYCLQICDISDNKTYFGKTRILNKITRVRK